MKEIHSAKPPLKPRVSYKTEKRKKVKAFNRYRDKVTHRARENVMKKKIKKIRIRLADPNVPDSYICEVFDSSVERDEKEASSDIEDIEDNSIKTCTSPHKRNEPKIRDYFDILMSSESRRTSTLSIPGMNENIEKTKFLKTVNSDEVITKSKLSRHTKIQRLNKPIQTKKNDCGSSSSSSDDESIFTIKSKLKISSSESIVRTDNGALDGSFRNTGGVEYNKENKDQCEEKFSSSDVVCLLHKKNTSSILNYFSKSIVNKKKANLSGKVLPLKNCDIFHTSHKLITIEEEVNSNVEYTKKKRERSKCSVVEKHVFNITEKPENLKIENCKLAPLFQKKTKHTVDPNVRKARLEFLRSGLPTNVKKAACNQSNSEDKCPVVYFPSVSHVQQIDDDDDDDCSRKAEDISIPYLRNDEEESYTCDLRNPFRFRICPKNSNISAEIALNDKVQTLKTLQFIYRDTNIDSIFKSLKKKKKNFLRKCEVASLSMSNGNQSDSGDIPDPNLEIFNSLWTDIYKPTSSEIIGNRNVVTKLDSWLRSWKEFNSEMKRLRRTNVKAHSNKKARTYDNDDDFVLDSDESLDLQTPGNICIISGPISSGKTALVYALASELEFNVLEVNSSCKRTGKQLLTLQEATKSHQVRSGFGQLPRSESFMKKENTTKAKKKRRKKEADINLSLNSSYNGTISLILVEEADIFFEEHDDGYASALLTLVQSSKRPFIFLTNDPICGYFGRLKSQQILSLEMRRPNFHSLCAVLNVIAFIEGISVETDSLQCLLRNNNFDFRRSLLEMQFWIQSGGNIVRDSQVPFALGRLWWGFNRFLYNEENVHYLKLDYTKRKRKTELYDSSSDDLGEEPSKKVKLGPVLQGGSVFSGTISPQRKSQSTIQFHSEILDCLSLIDLFETGDDLEPVPPIQSKPKDSLSLNECMDSVDWNSKDLSRKIINELIELSTSEFNNKCGNTLRSNYFSSGPSWSEMRWRSIQSAAKRDLTSLVPFKGENHKRVLYLDYLPIIRNICRTEKFRYFGNTKRKNRFHHYLKTLGIDPQEESLDINCDVLETKISP